MATLSNYSLRYLLLCSCFLFYNCTDQYSYYKKGFTEAEKKALPKKLVNGIFLYYQGTPEQQFLLQEAMSYDDTYADIYRELGVPYLKRGIAEKFPHYYGKAADLNPLDWLGWRGYLYLFFYRDYERALADFIEADQLTPDVVDYPQSMNIDFMKGICHLKMGEQKEAIEYFNKQIAYETKTVGLEYIESITFLYKGIAYWEMNQLNEAKEAFETGATIDSNNADLPYWLAKLALKEGQADKASKHLSKAKTQFLNGYFNRRNYVESFYQTYLTDITDLEDSIEPTLLN